MLYDIYETLYLSYLELMEIIIFDIAAVIIRHYGLLGFFFIVALLIFSGGVMNREAFVSPLSPIELYYKGVFPFVLIFILIQVLEALRS